MSDDILDFLDADPALEPTTAEPTEPPAEAAPAPEADAAEAADPAAEPANGQPRDDKGRFAPKADEPAAASATPPAAEPKPAEPNPDVGGVMRALLDERDRRQAAERERDALRQQQQDRQPLAPPDQYEDPEGFAAFQQAQIDSRFQQLETSRLNDKLNFSERLAGSVHGKAAVDEAKAWGLQIAAQDPAFQQRVIADPDPYEYLVAEHKRHQAAQLLRDPATLEQFRAWQTAQAAAAQAPAAPAPALQPAPVQAPPAPPRSIVHAPAAGSGKPGEVPVGPGVAFDHTFR